MVWIATAEECRQLDRDAEAQGISVEQLMQEAGRAIAACVLEEFQGAKRIAVVCGKGNNGGDGLVAARLLAEREKDVSVLIAAGKEELNPNARRELDRLQEPGVTAFFTQDDPAKVNRILRKADLIVDALLGTGARGVPEGSIRSAIEAINAAGRAVLSVDIPSGVDCDSGATPGDAVIAKRTLTFGLPKPFLFQGEGTLLAGEWSVAPIGFPPKLLEAPRGSRLADPEEARSLLPKRTKASHKHAVGSVLIVAGSERMPGAAALCARAALRAGAGLVAVASVPSVCEAVAQQLPEAILIPLPEERGAISPDAAPVLTQRKERFQAAVVGPGLSLEPSVAESLRRLFEERTGWRYCLDADALTHVVGGVPLPTEQAVLTPHAGEMARLIGWDPARILHDRFGAVREAAGRTGKDVLLKGAYSLTTGHQQGVVVVNTSGNPGLASPGTGDVLAGLVGTLLTRLPSGAAAMAGAYWHGLAGDLCAAEIGPAGFLASELADMLPKARATIAAA
jgi:NAD(P)H-hydrate epimerase